MPDQKESILVGALVVALLSTSYLGLINCLCCAGVILGAATSVWHYTSTYELTIEPGRGAVMGLAAAALGSFVAIFINYALAEVGLGANEVLSRWVMDLYEGRLSPEQMDQLRAQMQQGQSLGQRLLYGGINVVISALFGAIGGAIGAAIFKKGGDEPGTASPGARPAPPVE